MLTKMMTARVRVILWGLLFALLGASSTYSQSPSDKAMAAFREREHREGDRLAREKEQRERNDKAMADFREREHREGDRIAREKEQRERNDRAMAEFRERDHREGDRIAARRSAAPSNRSNPLPYSSLEGTRHYYNGRSLDYRVRNLGRRDPYYKPFGEKYYNRYTNEVSRTLSPRGQEFIGKVGPTMQRLIEERLKADPAAFARMERNPVAFGRFVSEIHQRSYYESGWAALPSSDQWKILHAIDPSDLMSKAARDAALSLAPGLVGNNPTRPGRQQYNQPRGVPGTTRDGRHYRF